MSGETSKIRMSRLKGRFARRFVMVGVIAALWFGLLGRPIVERLAPPTEGAVFALHAFLFGLMALGGWFSVKRIDLHDATARTGAKSIFDRLKRRTGLGKDALPPVRTSVVPEKILVEETAEGRNMTTVGNPSVTEFKLGQVKDLGEVQVVLIQRRRVRARVVLYDMNSEELISERVELHKES